MTYTVPTRKLQNSRIFEKTIKYIEEIAGLKTKDQMGRIPQFQQHSAHDF